MSDTVAPLRFRVGARTLWTLPRRVERVIMTLDEALSADLSRVPSMASEADGLLVNSIPETLLDQLAAPGFICFVRERYTRYYAALDRSYDEWLAGLSANARSSLRRKQKRLAQHADGLRIRSFHSPAEMREFQRLARPVAALTYQERLLGEGLPDAPDFLARAEALAAQDRVRAWLLTLGERPVAYLWCSAEGTALRYDYVGHDPEFSDLSPGTVLHAAAFAELFGEHRFARFDFTEGDGQHKRQFATGGIACADVLLLRDTIANRAAVRAVRAFDHGVAVAKRALAHPRLAGVARRVRRAS